MCVLVFTHVHTLTEVLGAGLNNDGLGPAGLWCVHFQSPADGLGHPRDQRIQLDHGNIPPFGPGSYTPSCLWMKTERCLLLSGSFFTYLSLMEDALLYSSPEARYISVILILIC